MIVYFNIEFHLDKTATSEKRTFENLNIEDIISFRDFADRTGMT
jgi:hypothetical protein